MDRPYTLIFSTMTVDGRIASSTGFSSLSCPYDLYRLRLLRGMVEAVMVGAGTVLMDNPRLIDRVVAEWTPKTYYRVVVDGKLRIAGEVDRLRILREDVDKVIVFTATRNGVDRVRETGANVHVVGRNGRVDLGEALNILYAEYGVTRLLVEGGGRLSYSLIAERLVDEVRATITPYVFGAGVSIVEDPESKGFTTTAESPKARLECYELCPCGNCIHLVYSLDSRCCPAGEPPPRCLSPLLQKLYTSSRSLRLKPSSSS